MATRPDIVQLTENRSAQQLIAASKRLHQDALALTRLIVLVPSRGINHNAMAHRIWSLASPCQINVLFLSLSNKAGAEEEDDTRIHLATLASMTRDENVQVETRIEVDDNWVSAVRKVWQPGDAVICAAEQSVKLCGAGWQPLSGVLEHLLDIPVYVVPGLLLASRTRSHEPVERKDKPARLLSSLMVPILIVAGFFFLQVRINSVTTGLVHTALLCTSAVVEVGLIGMWGLMSH